jgi:uncharacterized protein YbjT (DUF2867 family)
VRRLHEAGHEVRVLTRGHGESESRARFVTGDLLTGAGVAEAVEGVDTIVHCAGSNRGDEVGTRNLVAAARQSGRPHLVYISVVGADRVPVSSAVDRMMFSYFAMKRQAEQVVAESGLPWTTLRATQFYELLFKVAEALAKLPIVPVASGASFQPVDSADVAERMVELALGPPSGLVPDIAGPRAYRMAELMRSYLEAAHRRRLLVPLWLPGKAARAVRDGAVIAPNRAVGKRTWEEFLAAHVSQAHAQSPRPA